MKQYLMKKIYILILCTTLMSLAESIELVVSGAQHTQMPIAILILDKKNDELSAIANIIKKDLAFTDQFQPSIKKYNVDVSKKELRKNILNLANSGVPLALCIDIQSSQAIEWRLYDTIQCTMLQGKKYKKKGTAVRGWAHAIADEARKTLTGNGNLFFFTLNILQKRSRCSWQNHT